MRARPEFLPRLWPVVLPLAMIVSTEYKLRLRPLGQALQGSLDPTVLFELAVYALIFGYLMYYFARPPRIRKIEPVLFSMWAYTSVTVVSALYSIYATQAVARGVQLLAIAGLAQAIATRATRADMHRLAHAYLGLVCLSVAFGFIHPYPPFSYLQAGRFTWLYVHPVIAGAILAIAFTIAVAYTLLPRPLMGLEVWPRSVTGAIAGVTGIALVLTKTRGSIAAGAVAALVLLVVTRPRVRRAEAILSITTFGFLIAFAAGSLIIQYLQRGENAQELSTLSNRTVLWSLALHDFSKRPLFGYGFTASRGLFFDEVKLGGAHNAVINVIIDAGIIGLVVWLAFLFCTIYAVRQSFLRRRTRVDATILGGLLVCLIVNSLTTEGLGSGVSVSAIWLYLIAAWVLVARRTAPEPMLTQVATLGTNGLPTTLSVTS
jgi:exopolysaccharide production protein ExoQ